MKRIIAFSFFLLAVSLACQTVQRAVAPATPTAEASPSPLPELTPSATATATLEPTPSPTVTRVAPTPIVCTDDSCLNACLKRVKEELSTQPQNQIGGEYAESDTRLNLVTYLVINGDGLSQPRILQVPAEYKPYQQDTSAHLRVWDFFTSLVPAEQRKWIVRYTIFTDGNSNALAWVRRENSNNTRWEMGVDILDSTEPIDLTKTIIHETAHLVTLNPDQIVQNKDFPNTPYQNKDACPQLNTSEGCSTPDSYIYKFYQKFWMPIYEDWLENVYKAKSKSEEDYDRAVGKFYSEYQNLFAQGYAATSIEEDMAVSFEYFIVNPMATGSSFSAKKMRFFYDYPELVALRQQMIQGMCSYAQ